MKAEYAQFGLFDKGSEEVKIVEFSHKLWGYPDIHTSPTAFVIFKGEEIKEVQLHELKLRSNK